VAGSVWHPVVGNNTTPRERTEEGPNMPKTRGGKARTKAKAKTKKTARKAIARTTSKAKKVAGKKAMTIDELRAGLREAQSALAYLVDRLGPVSGDFTIDVPIIDVTVLGGPKPRCPQYVEDASCDPIPDFWPQDIGPINVDVFRKSLQMARAAIEAVNGLLEKADGTQKVGD